jgi:membrane-associated phospholipid phosphatase
MKRWIVALDASLGSRSQPFEQSPFLRSVAAVFAHSGDSWFWLLGLILLWGFGSEYWKQMAVTLGIGVIVAAVIVMAIKFTVRRSRPAGEWGKIYRNTDPHSFPSGHATRAAMLATLAVGLAPAWLALILVVWAPLVGLARALLGVHYLSDIVGGMALGVLFGLVLLHLI